jgi:hypothetical protein
VAAEYQESDWPVADYACFVLDPKIGDPSRYQPLAIRGPRPESLAPGDYFVCLGAAQTFGRFCTHPFPTLLSERLGIPVLNISHGGAGPSFFCYDNARLLGYLNGARFVVVQAMSGRSESNSLFESRGVGHYRRRSDGQEMGSDAAFEELLKTRPKKDVKAIVEETRASWLASYRQLLSGITAPTIAFWFSTRKPDERSRAKGVAGLFGQYPQLVNGSMMRTLGAECDYAASCVSRRGLPQSLVDRESGKPVVLTDPWSSTPWEKNWYYPSPEMHEDAADALEEACRKAAGLPSTRRRWWRFLSRS